MELDLSAVKRVGEVLFDSPDNELASQAMGYMMLGQPECSVPGGFDYEAVLKLCLKSTSSLAVAKVVVAGVATSPLQAHFWLEEIGRLFVRSGLSETVEPLDQATPGFMLGLALGLFQAQVWLDEHIRIRTPFEDMMPGVAIQLAFCHHPQTEKYLEYRPNEELQTRESRQNESALSKVIKAWVRPKPDVGHVVGRRLVQVTRLLKEAHAKMKDMDKDEELPRFSSLILDQVCYADFGSLSTSGRVMALDTMFSQILSGLARR